MAKKVCKIFSVMLCAMLLLSAMILPVSALDDTGDFYGVFKNSYDNSPISNLKVKITDVYDETIVYTTKTDSDGKYTFLGLPESMYLVTIDSTVYEVDDKEEYNESRYGTGFVAIVSVGDLSSYVKGGDTRTLTRVNGNVALNKTCTETGAPVKDAVYELYELVDDEYVLVDSYTTDEEGKIILKELDFGSYKFKEKSATGYYVNAEELPFVLSVANPDVTLEQSDDLKCSVKVTKTDADTNEPLKGVKFDLYKTVEGESDELVGHYTTDDDGVISEYVRVGNYYFVETEALENYEKSDEKYTFTCSALIPNVEMFIGNTHYPLVRVIKYKENTTEYVEGAGLRISKDGNTVVEFTTDAEAYELYLAPGNYVLSEINCPSGYVAAADIPFTVSYDKENTVIMYDALDVYTIDFHKTDAVSGEELFGATMKLSCVETGYEVQWVTAGKAHTVENLTPGTYVYEELEAPDGYLKGGSITFVLLPNQESNIESLTMFDDYTKVSISKLDKKTGEHVSGAKLHLEDEQGNIIDSWTTDGTAYNINMLPAGAYTLIEDEAPAGYEKAKDLGFTVTETGEVLEVKFYNERTSSEAPKTGDNSPLLYVLFAFVISAITLLILGYRKFSANKAQQNHE